METIKVKIINRSHHPLPAYATPGSAGMDVRAYLPDGPIVLKPMARALIPTGLYMQLPHGYECQIRPRSGLAIKHGISLVNTPGTVDSDYRGEIGVGLVNLGSEPYTVQPGDRIAQLMVVPVVQPTVTVAEDLDETDRGAGGFGSTGR